MCTIWNVSFDYCLCGLPHPQVLSTSLIFSVLYVWCRINKTTIVQFWFGVQVPVNIWLEYRATLRVVFHSCTLKYITIFFVLSLISFSCDVFGGPCSWLSWLGGEGGEGVKNNVHGGGDEGNAQNFIFSSGHVLPMGSLLLFLHLGGEVSCLLPKWCL